MPSTFAAQVASVAEWVEAKYFLFLCVFNPLASRAAQPGTSRNPEFGCHDQLGLVQTEVQLWFKITICDHQINPD